MKLATFNINNVNKRLPNLLRWLKQAKPDIVCLQELKCEAHDFPRLICKEQAIRRFGKVRSPGMELQFSREVQRPSLRVAAYRAIFLITKARIRYRNWMWRAVRHIRVAKDCPPHK